MNKYQIIGAIAGIIGFIIISFNTSIGVGVGVLLMLFGNNLEQRKGRY